MKNKLVTLICIILCSIVVIWDINVFAEENYDNVQSVLKVSKTKVKANDKFTVSIYINNGLHNGLGKFNYNLSYDSKVFKYLSYSMGPGENKEEVKVTNDESLGVINAVYENAEGTESLDNGILMTFTFEVNLVFREETFKFGLSGGSLVDRDGKKVYGYTVGSSVDLFVASNNNYLSSLTISEGTLSPAFNREIVYYTATVDAASVVIKAVPADIEKGSVKNTGTKGLNFGENVFNIISTAESGSVRVYKLVINRTDTRNSDNTLKSITGISNFRSDVTEYNVEIPTKESSYTAEAFANDSKATIKYNPSSKRVLLDYGETKKITITVTAENTTKKDYVINVTRRDDRDTNNLLQSLTVSGATINFEPNTNSYKVMVDNKYESVIINAIAQSPTSVVSGIGAKPLREGSNTFAISVKSESGSEKVYSLVVIRKDSEGKIGDLSNNTKLKSLKFNTTNVPIRDGVYSYEISLPNSSEMGEIFYETEDPKSIVSLEGNRDLKVGKNYYRIRVTAENGQTMVYELTVFRQQIQNFVKNNKDDIINAIKHAADNIVTVSVDYDDTNRSVDETVVSTLKNSSKSLSFQVFDENKQLDYSVTLNSRDIKNVVPLDYNLLNVSSNKDKIDSLSNASSTVYMNFEGNKELPGTIKVVKKIGDTFSEKNPLTLYYYNDSEDDLD